MSGGETYDWLKEEGPDAWLLFSVQSATKAHHPSDVGVAVSGGSDSMALLLLAARVAHHAGWRLEAVTVDHRLRPESAGEADAVARVCATLDVPHTVVVWEHGEITGNLMDQARRARYRLISDWARARGIHHIALGHTADDQAETFLMGLARSAGLDGLSGMRSSFEQDEVTFVRPLLFHPRADLRAYLSRHGQGWMDDPTNDNDRFMRTKARRALKALKPLGITVDRLTTTIQNLRGSQRVVLEAVVQAATEVITEKDGALFFDRRAFLQRGFELDRLLLQEMLRWMTGLEHSPRADSIGNLQRAFVHRRDATLAGCRFRSGEGQVTMTREPRAVAALSTPTDAPWDNRWHLSGPHAPDLTVRALGANGLRACKDWRDTGLPREVLIVTPAVWRGENLVAAPLAGWPQGWTATVSPSFHATILAH